VRFQNEYFAVSVGEFERDNVAVDSSTGTGEDTLDRGLERVELGVLPDLAFRSDGGVAGLFNNNKNYSHKNKENVKNHSNNILKKITNHFRNNTYTGDVLSRGLI